MNVTINYKANAKKLGRGKLSTAWSCYLSILEAIGKSLWKTLPVVYGLSCSLWNNLHVLLHRSQ